MNARNVGKKAEPTVEELEFIYERLARLSDGEILADMQDTVFPLRSPGFIKRRRKEFDTAKKVLHVQLQKEVDPLAVKRREEHFRELAAIIDDLLANDLGSVSHGWSTNRVAGQDTHILTRKNTAGDYYDLTNEQLSTRLKENYVMAEHKYERWFIHDCLIPHLKSELPEELKSKAFLDIAKEHPYELIQALRILAARKTFKGTCPVCKDW